MRWKISWADWTFNSATEPDVPQSLLLNTPQLCLPCLQHRDLASGTTEIEHELDKAGDIAIYASGGHLSGSLEKACNQT
jgi:hypothetical protein